MHGELLRKTVRPSDLVARLGGDEFALWLNGADHMTAAERAERLCVEVPRELRTIAGTEGPTPTVSIGIATRGGSVDGGVNPRKSGAGRKVGTKIAVEQFEANGLGGGPLSMPSAAVRRWPKASIYRGLPPSHDR